MAKNDKYESDDILSLSDCEHIRTRPTLYIGTVESPLHCASEIVFNAIDEAMVSTKKKPIEVIYDSKSNKLTVSDQFRGIPIGQSLYKNSITGETTKVESLQLLFMTLNSGGKMGGTKAYSYSAGLHGQGTCIVNSLSEYLKVTTYRKNKAVELITSHGNLKELNYLDNQKQSQGVTVEFIPDKTIFDSLKIPKDSLIDLCAVPNAFGIKINLTIDDELIKMPYNSLVDLLPEMTEDENELLCHEINLKSTTSDDTIRVIFRYTSATNTIYRGYANMLHQSEGGTHVRYFDDIWKKAWQKYLTDDFKIQDTSIGLRALVAVTINNSSLAFSNQVKSKLTTPKTYFSSQFDDKLIKSIQNYFDTHDTERKGLIKRFTDFRQAQNKMLATKELSQLVIVNNNMSNNIRRASIVDKLIECTSRDRKNTQLFIVEGDSAAQGLIETRDLKYHAILPLRGKTLNVSKKKSDIVECVKNAEVRSIINAAGTGVGEGSDYTKSRYEQYKICCFTGDTRVKMLDGTVKTFNELTELEKANPGRDYWVYSVDENGNTVPGRGFNPRITGYTKKLAHVILDDDTEIRCTPEHLFMTVDGGYVQAQNLVAGQSLTARYFRIKQSESGREWNDNHEFTYEPNQTKWIPTHQLVKYHFESQPFKGAQIHHIDHNPLNNVPTNLTYLSAGQHGSVTLVHYNKSDRHRQRVSQLQAEGHYDHTHFSKSGEGNKWNGSQAQKDMLQQMFIDHPEYREIARNTMIDYNKSDQHRETVAKMNSSEEIKLAQRKSKIELTIAYLIKSNQPVNQANYELCRMIGCPKFNQALSYYSSIDELIEIATKRLDEVSIEKFEQIRLSKLKSKSPEARRNKTRTSIAKVIHLVLEKGLELNAENYQAARVRSDPKFENITKFFDTMEEAIEAGKNYNHSVKEVRIEELEDEIPVYDITIDKYHNFILPCGHEQFISSGVCVHNSDSDPDGYQISSLVISIFVNLLPAIVKAGMLYVIQPPLYGWTDKQGQHYSNNLNDVTNLSTLHRYKGLGEFDAEELYEVCVKHPVNLLQVQYPEDINLFNEVMTSSQLKFKTLLEKGYIKYT